MKDKGRRTKIVVRCLVIINSLSQFTILAKGKDSASGDYVQVEGQKSDKVARG